MSFSVWNLAHFLIEGLNMGQILPFPLMLGSSPSQPSAPIALGTLAFIWHCSSLACWPSLHSSRSLLAGYASLCPRVFGTLGTKCLFLNGSFLFLFLVFLGPHLRHLEVWILAPRAKPWLPFAFSPVLHDLGMLVCPCSENLVFVACMNSLSQTTESSPYRTRSSRTFHLYVPASPCLCFGSSVSWMTLLEAGQPDHPADNSNQIS